MQAPANPHLPHVVFVLMEGWSSHIALEHGDDNPVLGAFGRHAQEDHFFTHLFANTFATNSTIESLLVNSPVSPLSQSVARSTSFRLSNLLPFKRKGYRTAYVSGGYASWRNHDNFWPRQGFDRYIGRSEIEDLYEVEARDHPAEGVVLLVLESLVLLARGAVEDLREAARVIDVLVEGVIEAENLDGVLLHLTRVAQVGLPLGLLDLGEGRLQK